MRLFAICLSIVLSSSVFACPELTGSYSCEMSDGTTYSLFVTQRVEGEITIYNFGEQEGNGDDIITDGETREVPNDLDGTTYSAVCKEDALNIEMLQSSEERDFELTIDGNYTLTEEDDLQIDLDITGRFGDQDFESSDTQLCSRI